MTLKSLLRVTQDHWKLHHSMTDYDFLFAFHSDYGPIFHHSELKRNISRKSQFVHTRPASDAPVRVPVRILP